MLRQSERAAIVRADRLRREQRELEDSLGLYTRPMSDRLLAAIEGDDAPKHSMVVRADAKAMGAVTAHTTRVNAPWSSLRTKVVGIAPGTEHESDGTNTVRVRNLYDDTVNEVRDVASFRKGREHTPRKSTIAEATVTEVERLG